jgi:2-dehydropantoate 2-reductase
MNLNSICVFGVGGVGGYFGGKLAYAAAQAPTNPYKVYFLARGAHLAAIQRHGLILNAGEQQGVICKPALATDHIADLPSPDVYLLCVKGYDLDDAVDAISPKVGSDTVILPLLNGVDIYDRIRQRLQTGIVLPACVYIGTHIEKPGVVTQKGGDGLIICGPDPQRPDVTPQEFIALCEQAAIKLQWKAEPSPDIWGKYLFISAFGLMTAYSGKSLGEVMADPALQDLTRQIMAEVVAIAVKKGVAFAEQNITATLAKAANFPPETRTSYQRDVETPGKRNEGDFFGGTIIRMGQAVGVPTPVTQRIFAAIQAK